MTEVSQDRMDVIVHQHPGPDFDAGGRGVLGEEIAVERIILVAKEGRRPAVAAPGDVVRISGKDGTGEAGHAGERRKLEGGGELVHCHRNSP